MTTMSLNSEYVARMQAQLKQWDAELDALAARAEKSGEQARATIRELQASRDAARSYIDKIRFAGESAGAQLHAGMQAAFEALRKALEKAAAEMRD
jgi:hypothetical protein